MPALGGAPFRWRGGDLPLSSPKARGAGSPSCRAPPRRALPLDADSERGFGSRWCARGNAGRMRCSANSRVFSF